MAGSWRARRTTVGLVLTFVTLAAQVVVGASAAEARCSAGHEIQSTFATNGIVKVYELPLVNTCDNNKTYRALLWGAGAPYTYSVAVLIQNNGQWWTSGNTKAASLSDAETYSIYDANSNTWMVLCYTLGNGVRCGWGTWSAPLNITPYDDPDLFAEDGHHGVNSGF